MPIISVVGRKQPKMRLLIIALYVVLTAGAATMVYPFILMLSTSFTSPVDQNQYRLVPDYFWSDKALYRKYVEAKYNEDIVKYNAWLANDLATFEKVEPPKTIDRRFIQQWRIFAASLPQNYLTVTQSWSLSKITPEVVVMYRDYIQRKFHGDLDKLNQVYKLAADTWMEVDAPPEDWASRSNTPEMSSRYRDWLAFKKTLPKRFLMPVPVDGLYEDWLKDSYGNLTAVNAALGTHCPARSDIHLAARVPPKALGYNWEKFVRRECPVQFVRIDGPASPAYRTFLAGKYRTTALYNRAYGAHVTSYESLQVPTSAPSQGVVRVDWIEFLQSDAPIHAIRLETPEIAFRRRLRSEYGTVARMDQALGTGFRSWEDVTPPYAGSDWLELKQNRAAIRWEFIIRNYRDVVDYILLHGRAFWNTVILCLAMVLGALTVNPLCAYALSRFNLRSTYKILLFLLATMAFPAEVSAIPGFLLIKDLHLLETYWAIILPGLANGYSIFLLKGFFDSLPKELFEAATIDGASEVQMFWNITMKLSKPVLAVIALWAFTSAYGSFMWAFLVLQDPRMWTLMVWLYQMQIWAPQFLVYAGLVLAAIPTLLVFIFCQNIIMQGIIIPSEK